ncbi:hypothetical protein Rt10032_c02g1190 [Rhodotorula toruloides]|uniref:DUF7719 domain-containing protein n=1 Tax=Rhodotorula toruloides TaxID=5286 RepID=A0A511K9W6_RHOTO|nr:hypothetical protein Rt10032_c02g1190 [Rhodotorula toruloides]
MTTQKARLRTKSSEGPSAASWSPSPSPPLPSSPSTRAPDLTLSHADRRKLLEQHGPMRPSELGLPNGKDMVKDPMVVFSPEELERLVQQQRLAGSEGTDAVKEAINGERLEEELEEVEEELMLWEEVVNAILWTIPFGFLFTGMDYAVHAQFGQELVPPEELTHLLDFLPALLLLNFIVSRPSSRALLPSTILQSALTVLSISVGISTIHTCTSEGYLRVISRAPALGVVWCWTIVRLELGWSVLALAGVGLGVWMTGGDIQWLKGLV